MTTTKPSCCMRDVAALAVIGIGAVVGLSGCAVDEPVGTTKTTTKTVVDTPTEKTTTTETHEKDTKLYPK